MSGSMTQPYKGICDHCCVITMVSCDEDQPQFQYCEKCYIDYILPWLMDLMNIDEN